tara:strand:+ start:264 stop:515 length:252 start_codon:yes stop_codon:yes gene_type:complete
MFISYYLENVKKRKLMKEMTNTFDNAVNVGKAQGILSSQEQALDLVKQDISSDRYEAKSTLRKLDMIQEGLIEAQKALEQIIL